jgi:peptidoglycan/xylan/chitin deacetylase (PgdA/CDA1 family)
VAPLDHGGFLSESEIRELNAQVREIGAHSLSHPDLRRLGPRELEKEVGGSRRWLQQVLGTDVSAFCYPSGKWNPTVRRAVVSAGFRSARTTTAFNVGGRIDAFALPVTLQLYNHSRQTHVKHALREGNVTGLVRWLGRWRGAKEALDLAKRTFDSVYQTGGIFHLWGHSRELSDLDLWAELTEILQHCGRRPECRYVTNSGLLEILSEEPSHPELQGPTSDS